MEHTTEENVEYAKFWNRAGAHIIDAIVVGLFTFALNYLNIMHFKSFLFYLPIAVIAILYKPYMESKYGATYGKMLLNLKVTDYNFKQLEFKQSFKRSFILIFPTILYIPIYFLAFNNEMLTEANGIVEFTQGIQTEYPLQGWIGNIGFFILLADIIALLTDATKTKSSLHDQIAKTYVLCDRK
jgi:uncharacterized RDD family membrane protein YckC